MSHSQCIDFAIMNDLAVLILDDDQIDRMSLERFCKKNNIHYYSASNGLDALNLFRSHDIQLVFSDIDMPEMDGIQFLQKLKEIPNFNSFDIPVIAVTGNEQKDFKVKFKDFGFDYFISKPPLADQLNYVLNHFVHR